MTANPWDVLAEHHPDLAVVRWPIRELGRYYHQLRTIVIRKGLRIVEERSTLWHELVHAERGDEQCTAKDEARVEREAARRAVDLHELADAMIATDHLEDWADACKVTEDLLRVRLEHLHPSERGYLKRRLSMKEHCA